jgi:hypothetical protein
MSDFQAIGGVSATIKALLEDRMQLLDGISRTNLVTIGAPMSERDDNGSRINLFLYRIEENYHLKNQEIPGHGHPGDFGHPPLSLDLYYLITAYGSKTDSGGLVDDTWTQFLLGSAMQVLHEHQIIDERLIEINDSDQSPILHQSLRGQFERVKLYLEPLSLEDLSKVWTSLTLPYRLSVAYKVSVVQIESLRQKHKALPVLDLSREESPRAHVVPFRQPQISSIEPVIAKLGERLTIRGLNLGSAVEVKIGRRSLPAVVLADGRIWVTLPAEHYPEESTVPMEERLRAGPQNLQVVAEVPTMPGRRFSSNLAVFMLAPEINEERGGVNPTSGGAGSSIGVSFTPAFYKGDRAYLFVGDVGIEAQPLPSQVTSSYELEFLLPSLPEQKLDAGTYPLRLRINGAESSYEYTLVDGIPVPRWSFQVLP